MLVAGLPPAGQPAAILLPRRAHLSFEFAGASRYGDRVHERGPLTLGVECYAGHRGEQTPRALILGDRRLAVGVVLDAWLAPDHRYFKLRCEDGDTYLVRHDERSNTWELTMFRAGHEGDTAF